MGMAKYTFWTLEKYVMTMFGGKTDILYGFLSILHLFNIVSKTR